MCPVFCIPFSSLRLAKANSSETDDIGCDSSGRSERNTHGLRFEGYEFTLPVRDMKGSGYETFHFKHAPVVFGPPKKYCYISSHSIVS